MKNIQEWLKENYHVTKWSELDISGRDFEGELDLSKFSNLREINITGNPRLRIIKKPWLCKVYVDAQEWIDQRYPDKKTREVEWEGSTENILIKGKLIIADYPYLKEVNIRRGEINELEIINCPQLVKINCYHNFLVNITLFSALEELDISDNDFSKQNLFFLSHLVNLKELKLGNWDRKRKGTFNRFQGSLEFLQKLVKLKELEISYTNIDSGLEYLPTGLQRLHCNADDNNEHEQFGCQKLKEQLEIYGGNYLTWKENNQELITVINSSKAQLAEILKKNNHELEGSKENITELQNELAKLQIELTKKEEILKKEIQNNQEAEKEITKLTEKAKQLEIENTSFSEKNKELEALESFSAYLNFNEFSREYASAMESWYRRLGANTGNYQDHLNDYTFFKQFREKTSKEFLEINQKNKQSEQRIKELENTIELIISMEELESQRGVSNTAKARKRIKELETGVKNIFFEKHKERKQLKQQPEINWTNIQSNFTEQLIQNWQNHNFTSQQTQDWINVGFQPQDYDLVNFVRNNLGYDVETILNNANLSLESLRNAYERHLQQNNQQTQIIQTNFPNFQNK